MWLLQREYWAELRAVTSKMTPINSSIVASSEFQGRLVSQFNVTGFLPNASQSGVLPRAAAAAAKMKTVYNLSLSTVFFAIESTCLQKPPTR